MKPFVVFWLALVTAFSINSAGAAGRQTISGHRPPGISRLAPVDRMAADRQLDITIGLPLRDREELTNLLQQIYDPASTNFHHYLRPEEFAARFGPSESDYQTLIAFANSNHLAVTTLHSNRTLVALRGSTANIERAFHVNLRVFKHPTEARNFFAPDAEPSVDLAIPVLGVSGLDDFVIPHPANLKTNALFEAADDSGTPQALPAGSGPRGNFIGGDFRAAYAPGVTLDGTGQSIGFFELDGYYPGDIRLYEAIAGLPNITLTNVLLDGATGGAGGNNVEVALDIETAIAMAPGLSRVIVYEGFNYDDVLNRMATDNQAQQLSSSWFFGSANDPLREQIFQQFAAQGQSFFESSGDNGAFTGSIPVPADEPFATVVGGTSLTTTTPGGAWLSETAWPSSGGGISTTFPIPIWQEGLDMTANQGSSTKRNLPDVACLGDAVFWIVANNGQNAVTGGTSASTPLWAAFCALANQQAALNGSPSVGFLNPSLYTIGKSTNSSAAFHDITTGNNFSSGSGTHFSATTGYDLCTGWGSMTGSNMITALLPPTDALQIIPADAIIFSGPTGGPFSPSPQTYTLTNSGSVPLDWSLANLPPWLDADVSSGRLSRSKPVLVNLTPNAAANTLAPGNYSATIWFTNLNDDFAQSRQVTLAVISFISISNSTLAPLFSFTGGDDGGGPNELIQLADGRLYGTTRFGGEQNAGTIFAIAPGGFLSSLYSFTGTNDGANPFAALTQGADGNLYGTTFQGGLFDNGTLFETDTNGNFTTITSFNMTDGDLPFSKLATGSDGNFYGTTYQGSPSSFGSVYRVSPGGSITTIRSFTNDANGALLHAAVTVASDGSLYGTTFAGGTFNLGTVFKISTNGIFTSLLSFAETNGANPYGGVVQGVNGNFYGVTANGGSQTNGVLFEMSPGGAILNLYSFTGGSDGAQPAAPLLLAADGNFYGSTPYGGVYGDGTLFRLAPDFTLTTIAQFDGFNGANPQAALTQGTDGNLYGTTPNGGSSGHGAIFVFSVQSPPQFVTQPQSTSAFIGSTVIFSVSTFASPPLTYQWYENGARLSDGPTVSGSATPTLTLKDITPDSSAAYYVTIQNALNKTNSHGAFLTVLDQPLKFLLQPTNLTLTPGATANFSIAVSGNQPITYQWQRNGLNLTNAGNISGVLSSNLTITNVTEANNGNYSILVSNALGAAVSSNGSLTVIPVSAPGTLFTGLRFYAGGNDGSKPSRMTLGSDGNLYGTTQFGGASRRGAVYRVGMDGTVTNIASFGLDGGFGPSGGVVQGLDGNYYGTTEFGGTNAVGNVFSVTPDGTFTNLYSFTGGVDGYNPIAPLVRDAGGNFYGSTQNGGDAGLGNIFRVTPDGELTNIYSFTNGIDSAAPTNSLIFGPDGRLYGVTQFGGANSMGSVFRLTTNGVFSTIYSFTGGNDGSAPNDLLLGADGTFYGTTRHSTMLGRFQFYGIVFNLTTNGVFTLLYTQNSFDGHYPAAGLTAGNDGNFYGTCEQGGTNGNNGTIFRISPSAVPIPVPVSLVSFDGIDEGSHPEMPLTFGSDGNLYGTTSSGGPGGGGTIFRLSPTGAPVITAQPVAQTLFPGPTVSFSAAAFGAPTLNYHWLLNSNSLADGGNVSGSFTRVLTLSNVTTNDTGYYSVQVANSLGATTSLAVLLNVLAPPQFVSTIVTNGTFQFTWSAIPGHSYQLQSTATIAPVNWANLGAAINATNHFLSATNAINGTSQYYFRVITH
ncbi:MAG TPA: choice-of-anchor tandem repeat GloVer-containing protein [Verrucomicrobiae bacterium]|nr:choice-of-anchor tandem repeat GloVer-containing protein [Verrucomicrobiae bacterium]